MGAGTLQKGGIHAKTEKSCGHLLLEVGSNAQIERGGPAKVNWRACSGVDLGHGIWHRFCHFLIALVKTSKNVPELKREKRATRYSRFKNSRNSLQMSRARRVKAIDWSRT